MAAILQIVSGVGSTTPLLDLNDNPSGVLVGRGSSAALDLARVDFGSDQMPIWSAVGTVPEATSRTITLPVVLAGASIDAVGTKVQTLAKLTTAPWVLRVRRSGATADSWLRCYPTIPQIESAITGHHLGGYARGVITAQTEPYALGARVDKTATAVPQDASSAGAFVLDVTSPAGDAPTPVFIRCSDTTVVNGAHGTLFAVRRTGTPTNLTGLSTQATSATASNVGSNVSNSALSADAGLSGGVGRRFTFAAGYAPGANAGRMTYTPGISGAEAPGLYKLLARVRRDTSNGEYTFTTTVAGQYVLDPVIFQVTGTNTRQIDLGIIQLPAGQAQQLAAPTGVNIAAASPALQVDVQRTAGNGVSGTLDFDYFLLVPADEDLGAVYQSGGATGNTLTIDGYAQDAYLTSGDPLLAASVGYSGTSRLDYVGGVPRLYPGLTNRLFIVGGLNAAGSSAGLTSTTWSVSHWPRYTWLV